MEVPERARHKGSRSAGFKWYRQAKETKCGETGEKASSLSVLIVPLERRGTPPRGTLLVGKGGTGSQNRRGKHGGCNGI